MPDQYTTYLSFLKNRLGCVPESVWEKTELEALVLADNDLSELSQQIGCLRRLRMLDLGHNRLGKMPEALADLDGLTDFLHLHDNRLTSLPPSLERLTKLRTSAATASKTCRNAYAVWHASLLSHFACGQQLCILSKSQTDSISARHNGSL